MTWRWPLRVGRPEFPDGPGRFGAVRRHDMHTGVDIYTCPGVPVVAVEDGIVVGIEDFTGPKASSPWWHDTEAILVEGQSGVVCYGELAVQEGLKAGIRVRRGDDIGRVKTVLRKDKGRPTTMLHIELYTRGTRESISWRLGKQQPENLLDPTGFLEASLASLREAS